MWSRINQRKIVATAALFFVLIVFVPIVVKWIQQRAVVSALRKGVYPLDLKVILHRQEPSRIENSIEVQLNGPTWFRQLATKTDLTLFGNITWITIGRLTGADAAADRIANLKSLKWLMTLRSDLSTSGLKRIGKCTALEHLNLAYSHLDNSCGDVLVLFHDLITLSLVGCPLSDDAFLKFRNLQSLESLDVSYTKVTDDGIREIAQIPNLKELRVIGLSLSEVAFEHLTHSTELRLLWISREHLSDSTVASLQMMKGLEELRIDGPKLEPEEMQELASALPNVFIVQ